MIGRLHHLIIDGQDPLALATFYAELLGQPITYRSDDFVVVSADDTTSGLAFQLAPDHQPPAWPDPARPQQMHLDVMVEDVAAAGLRVLALGATKLDGPGVYADPAGHPFCLIPRPKWAPPVRDGPVMTEHVLGGGNVAAGVVRVGDTVRKPAGFWTPAVDALLTHLRRAGFTGAPQPLGRDDQGRQVLEYVPGPMAMDQPRLDEAGLHRVGRLIRELHDRTAGFSPPPGSRWNVVIPPDRADLVCHHDLAPWNLVTGRDRWVFIDWDGAGPGSRLWDLAYAMKGFVPLIGGGDPVADAPRLRALADGYRLSAGQRAELPPLIGAHTRGMADLLDNGARTGTQPWARLHAEGHGEHWTAAADYIERNLPAWRRALR